MTWGRQYDEKDIHMISMIKRLQISNIHMVFMLYSHGIYDQDTSERHNYIKSIK